MVLRYNEGLRKQVLLLSKAAEIKSNYYFYDIYDIKYDESNPKIKLNQVYSVGPSGGLMQTMYVYDVITKHSLSKDKVLVGTGTISTDGTVGEIGGARQKLITALIYHPTYFFVPADNYDEVIKQYDSINSPSISKDKIIKVETFSDVIKALKEAN